MELGEEASCQNNAVAGGLLRQVHTFAFIAMTHMLSGILSIVIVNRLNPFFQKDSVTISTTRPMVQSTITELEACLPRHRWLQNEEAFMSEITWCENDQLFCVVVCMCMSS